MIDTTIPTLGKILKIDRDYNLYLISKEEAIKLATPLIEEYNKKSLQISLEFKLPVQKITLKRFSFGK